MSEQNAPYRKGERIFYGGRAERFSRSPEPT